MGVFSFTEKLVSKIMSSLVVLIACLDGPPAKGRRGYLATNLVEN